MDIQATYELEVLVVGNVLNDRNNLKHIAVMPEYFFDQSCRAIIEYVTKHETYNTYDMCHDLDVNFELTMELATNFVDKKTFQDRVLKIRNYAEIRQRIWDEIVASQHAMAGGIDPLSAGSILITNLGNMLDERRV